MTHQTKSQQFIVAAAANPFNKTTMVLLPAPSTNHWSSVSNYIYRRCLGTLYMSNGLEKQW